MKYYQIYKPYGMLSQFTREGGKTSLADLGFEFEKDVYPVGRLDANSEGLLILTNDPSINQLLLQPEKKIAKKYLVLLDGNPDEEKMKALRGKMQISLDGEKHQCHFKSVRVLSEVPEVAAIEGNFKERKPEKLCWIEVVLEEGKNRQIRKMTASLNLPALRIIRVAIGGIQIVRHLPGEVLETTRAKLLTNLNL